MQISPATAPFQLTQNRRKQCDNLEALHRLINTGDLAAQAQSARHIIPIRGITTYWSPSFAPGLSPYISTVLNGAQRLFLIVPAHLHVALYEGARDHWTRRMLTDNPEMILSALPKRAMAPPSADAVASPRQLATLLEILDLPANHELPALHAASVSLLIDRVVLAKILPPNVADFVTWIKAGPDEKAA